MSILKFFSDAVSRHFSKFSGGALVSTGMILVIRRESRSCPASLKGRINTAAETYSYGHGNAGLIAA